MIQPIRLAWLVLFAAVSPIWSAVINLDYTYDVANGGDFFGTHPTIRATLERAASDVGAAITSSLAAVPSDVFNGTQGSSTASIDWSLNFVNPVTTTVETVNTFAFPASSITIFVGMRPLTGTTLGIGGPAGFGVSLGAGGPTGGREAAFMNAQANSNAAMPRGAGPTIDALRGDFTINGNPVPFDLPYGALAGRLSFDNDVNNDGTIDSFSALDDHWHFELTSPGLDNQNDFYTVAVHEILHAIGVGTSETWDNLSNGTTWSGSNAIALNGGSGANLVNGGHIAEGVMSTSIVDGSPQEVVMDPTIITGTRKFLTEMDLAFLRDLGYTTVPEPSDAVLLTAALLLVFVGLRKMPRRRSA